LNKWREKTKLQLIQAYAPQLGIRELLEENAYKSPAYVELKAQVDDLELRRKGTQTRMSAIEDEEYDALTMRLERHKDEINAEIKATEIRYVTEFFESNDARRTLFKDMLDEMEEKERAEITAEIIKHELRLRDEATALIREKGASVPASTAIHLCAQNGYLDALKFLLGFVSGADMKAVLNFRDTEGDTPLMRAAGAAYNNDDKMYDLLEHLIDVGANKDC
jgi:hypothetical protein